MIKKNLIKKTLFFFSAIVFFSSCTAEKDVVTKSSILKKSNSEISFSQFKKETKLHDFNTNIKIAGSSQDVAKGVNVSYELSDFDVNTDIIKRLELDNKVTYTFRIFPKVIISPYSFYNLTLDYKNGEWIQNVVELKPTLENFENLLSGSTNDISGEMSILFTSNSNSFNTTNRCYSVGIVGNNCESPVISEACVSKKYSTFCFGEENNLFLGEESEIFFETDSTNIDYSFILNTNDLKKSLTIFATNHVLINNQISTLLENESAANFDYFPYEELNTSQNEEDFKRAIANSGVSRYQELGDLILEQSKNASDFLINNKDFKILNEGTKQILINNAIEDAVNNNPINMPPLDIGNTTQARTCAQQYAVDKARCNQQNNLNGAAVLFACYSTIATGPGFFVGCGGGALLAMWANKICQANAREDYNDCME